MPGHEGVRDRDGGLPAARFAEPAVRTAELGADAGAGAACRPGAFGEDDADLGASIAGPAGLVFTGGLVAPGHNRDSRPVTQVGAGTRRVLSDLSWPNSADGRLQHRRKPGSPTSFNYQPLFDNARRLKDPQDLVHKLEIASVHSVEQAE